MKYKYLEFIRGAAALLVLINHLIGKVPAISADKHLIVSAIGAWGTESVIVFFVLSGIVINHVHTTKPQSTFNFLKKRAIRILPIYYICVVVALLIDYFTQTPIIPEQVIGTSFFVATLQGTLTAPITTIIVVWSLSFEVFFYVFFSFTIGRYQKMLVRCWFLLSIIACVLYYYPSQNFIIRYVVNMFAFSSLWLIGYYIYEYKKYFKTNFATALLGISLIPISNRLNLTDEYYNIGIFIFIAFLTSPMFLLALNQNSSIHAKYFIRPLHLLPLILLILLTSIFFSKSLMISKIIYGSLPFIALLFSIPLLNSILRTTINKIERFIIYTGGISFAFYLIHTPIIHFFGRSYPQGLYFTIIAVIALSYITSVFLERVYQKIWVKLLS